MASTELVKTTSRREATKDKSIWSSASRRLCFWCWKWTLLSWLNIRFSKKPCRALWHYSVETPERCLVAGSGSHHRADERDKCFAARYRHRCHDQPSNRPNTTTSAEMTLSLQRTWCVVQRIEKRDKLSGCLYHAWGWLMHPPPSSMLAQFCLTASSSTASGLPNAVQCKKIAGSVCRTGLVSGFLLQSKLEMLRLIGSIRLRRSVKPPRSFIIYGHATRSSILYCIPPVDKAYPWINVFIYG